MDRWQDVMKDLPGDSNRQFPDGARSENPTIEQVGRDSGDSESPSVRQAHPPQERRP
jgi:hypothetical protein